MPSVAELLRDSKFRALPKGEQLKGLSEVDAAFGRLPLRQKLKALADPEFAPVAPDAAPAAEAPQASIEAPALEWGERQMAIPPSQPSFSGPVTASGQRLPSAQEAAEGATRAAKATVQQLVSGVVPGSEQTGLPGMPAPPGLEYVSPSVNLLPTSPDKTIFAKDHPLASLPGGEAARNFLGTTARSMMGLVSGVGNAINAYGQAANAPVDRMAGAAIASAGKTLEDFVYQPELESPDKWTDPNFYAQILGSAMGSMMGFAGAGRVSMTAADKAVRMGRISEKLAPYAKTAAGAAASSILETMVQSGDTFGEAIEKGKSPEEAAAVAGKVAQYTLGPTLALNAAGLYNDTIKNTTRRIVASVLGEIAQEDAQQLGTNLAKDHSGIETPWHEGMAESTIGGAFGGLIGQKIVAGQQASPEVESSQLSTQETTQQQPSVSPSPTSGGSAAIPPEALDAARLDVHNGAKNRAKAAIPPATLDAARQIIEQAAADGRQWNSADIQRGLKVQHGEAIEILQALGLRQADDAGVNFSTPVEDSDVATTHSDDASSHGQPAAEDEPTAVTPVPAPQPAKNPLQRKRDEVREQQAAEGKLPRDLAGAKPRYSYGSKKFELEFESDIDRAAYIAAQPKPSKRDAEYVQFASAALGISEAEARALGGQIRDRIKAQAKDAEPGKLTVAKFAEGMRRRDDASSHSDVATSQGEQETVQFELDGAMRPGYIRGQRTTPGGKTFIDVEDAGTGKVYSVGSDRIKNPARPRKPKENTGPGDDTTTHSDVATSQSPAAKPVTPQVPADGTKYVLPSFATAQYQKPQPAPSQPGDAATTQAAATQVETGPPKKLNALQQKREEKKAAKKAAEEEARKAEEAEPGQESGPHGPIFREFRRNAKAAIAKLREARTGEAIAALYHPDVPGQDIDLVWDAGGKGLGRIIEDHPEVLGDLQGFLLKLKRINSPGSTNRVVLASEDRNQRGVVRLDFDGVAKRWLLTAYDRLAGSAPTGKTTDAPGSSERGEGTIAPSGARRTEPPAGRTIDVSSTHATERQAPPSSGSTPSIATEGGSVNTPSGESEQPAPKANKSYKVASKDLGERLWRYNSQRFATRQEALKAAEDQANSLAEVHESEDEPNYYYDDKKYEARPLSEKPAPKADAPTPDAAQETEDAGLIPGTRKLIQAVAQKLRAGEPIGNNLQFMRMAQKALGGTVADGAFDPKDAYDALEAGVNQYLLEIGPDLILADVKFAIGRLREILESLPTQAARTKEQQQLQQFSTPPQLAFVAAKALNIKASDVVLEPSAGVGGMALFAKAAGADVRVNEIASRRKALLKLIGFGNVTGADAEILHAVLDPSIRPTAILMNPPFSATGGRVSKNDNKFGFRHLDQAFQRLAPGGRLVAIMGEGARLTPRKVRGRTQASGASQFFKSLEAKGAIIRANVGIAGKEYQKYGTTFGTQLIIIDKPLSPAENLGNGIPLTGDYNTVEEAWNAIADIAADRTPVAGSPGAVRGSEPSGVQPAGDGRREPVRGPIDAGNSNSRSPEPRPEPSTRPARGSRRSGSKQPQPRTPSQSSESDARTDRTEPLAPPRELSGKQQEQEPPKQDEETDDGLGPEDGEFEIYQPAKLKEGRRHRDRLVESKPMAAVDPPDITYQHSIPREVIEAGKLSAPQLEAIAYAGQAHEQRNADGTRVGFFIGDGTGVGKGREIAGIIWDNFRKGQKKALWISVSQDLAADAERDIRNVGGSEALRDLKLTNVNKFKYGTGIDHEGTVYLTYDQLRGGSKSGKGTRLDQILKWKPDVIVFDEAHKGKNAVGAAVEHMSEEDAERDAERAERRGSRQMGGASKTGMAIVEIQRKLADARVVYVSATGATDVRNLGYATRLGLWGRGTPFPQGFTEFLQEITEGGVGAMEMIARELKALGRYVSRSLSYKGVSYREQIHPTTEAQREGYDAGAKVWGAIRENMERALVATGEATVDPRDGSVRMNGRAKMLAELAFWGNNQRFYSKLITAFKVPSVIEEAEKSLEKGNQVIISLIGTGEAQQNDQAAKAGAEGLSFDELDFSPRQLIEGYLNSSFPVELKQEVEDEHGNKKMEVVRDEKGNPVLSPEAVAIREALRAELRKVEMPENPLDQLINYFEARGIGVAELTGRKKRLMRGEDGKIVLKKRVEGVALDKQTEAEMNAFQNGGKRLAIISQKASTGISLHADLDAKNQQQRTHIFMELPWSADIAMQIFGRSHRSNQAQAPEYVIVSTDIGGERRFSSTIARRLASLGALTKGERKAGGGSDVLAKYNFESSYGVSAVRSFFVSIHEHFGRDEDLPPMLRELGREEIRKRLTLEEAPEGEKSVTTLLNRVLNLPVALQNEVFNHFTRIFDGIVERERAAGTFDDGTQDIRALNIEVREQKEIGRDENTGAETTLYELDLTVPVTPNEWAQALYHNSRESMYRAIGFARRKSDGTVWAVRQAASRANERTGALTSRVAILGVRRYDNLDESEYAERFEQIPQAEAQKLWAGQVAALPATEVKQTAIVSGSVLRMWQRLKRAARYGRMSITRVTAEGRRIVGIEIAPRAIPALEGTLAGNTPEAIFARVWQDGERVGLSGGVTLERRRQFGQDLFAITTLNAQSERTLDAMGLRSQRYGSQTLFYLPVDPLHHSELTDQSERQLGQVLERFPATQQQGGGATYMGSGIGALQPLYERTEQRVTKAVRDKLAKGSGTIPRAAVDSMRRLGNRVADETKHGKTLMGLLNKAADEGEVRAGGRVAKLTLDTELSKMDRAERWNLLDVLEGRAKPMNARVRETVKVVREVFDGLGDEAIELGVQRRVTATLYPSDPVPEGVTLTPAQEIRRSSGNAILVRYNAPFEKRKKYFPHTFPQVDQLKKGHIREDVIENLVRQKIKPDKEKAAQFLDDYVRFISSGKLIRTESLIQYLVRTKQARNEYAAWEMLKKLRKAAVKRQGSLEFSRVAHLPFYDPDPKRVLPAAAVSQSMRLAQVEHFGQEHQNIKRLVQSIRRAGGNVERVEAAMKKILAHIDEAPTDDDSIARFLTYINGFRLGLAAIPNATQGVLNTLLKTRSFEATAAGFRGIASKEGRRFGIESGAALEAILGEAIRTGGEDGRVLGAFLKGTGFSFTERMNRVFAANAGAKWAGMQARKLKLDPKNAQARAALAELGLDPAAVAKGGLTAKDLLMAAKKFSDITQFRSRPQDLPNFATHPWGKVFFQFKSYVYNQMALNYNAIAGGDWDDKLKSILILGLVFPLTGAVVNALRALLTGRDIWDRTAIEQYLQGAATVAVSGFLYDLAQSAVWGRVAEGALGPSVGLFSGSLESIARGNFPKFAFKQVPLIGQSKYLQDLLFPPKRRSGGLDPELRRMLAR